MFSKKRLDTIRKGKCRIIQSLFENGPPRPIYPIDFSPEKPSFYIVFNEDTGQYEIEKQSEE